MLRRAERIRNERENQRHRHKKIIRKMQAGVAASSFLIVCMGQVAGGTYSAFSDSEHFSDQLKACEVFPAALEKKFAEANDSVIQIVTLEEKIDEYQVNKTVFHVEELPEEAESAQAMKLADTLNQTLYEVQVSLSSTQEQLKTLENLWGELYKELDLFAFQLNEIQFNKFYHPNCLEMDNLTAINQLSSVILSDSLLDDDVRSLIITMIQEFREMKNYADDGIPMLSGTVEFKGGELIDSSKVETYIRLIESFKEEINILSDLESNLKSQQIELLLQADQLKSDEEQLRMEEEKKRLEEEKSKGEEKIEENPVSNKQDDHVPAEEAVEQDVPEAASENEVIEVDEPVSEEALEEVDVIEDEVEASSEEVHDTGDE